MRVNDGSSNLNMMMPPMNVTQRAVPQAVEKLRRWRSLRERRREEEESPAWKVSGMKRTPKAKKAMAERKRVIHAMLAWGLEGGDRRLIFSPTPALGHLIFPTTPCTYPNPPPTYDTVIFQFRPNLDDATLFIKLDQTDRFSPTYRLSVSGCDLVWYYP